MRLDLLPLPQIRRMQQKGIGIDREWLGDLGLRLESKKIDLQKQISSYIPAEALERFVSNSSDDLSINVDSAEQIGELLFKDLNIGADQRLKRTKSGTRISTGKKQLESLKRHHPVIPLILSYRECSKLVSTYCNALPRLARWDKETEVWRVHTQILTTRTDTGRLASKNPNCFSGDTEVLTHNGWVKLEDYRYDPVAQWEDGKISFVYPIDKIKTKGSLLSLRSQHIDLAVTPDHRCLLQHRKTKQLRVFHGCDYPEDWRQLNAGQYSGQGSEFTTAELHFMVALQADGSWAKNKSLDFSFQRPRKIKRFKQLLAKLKLKFRIGEESVKRTRFYIPCCELTDKLWELIGKQKLFPWLLLLRLSKSEAAAMLEEIMYWDGDFTRRSSYASKHKQNADFIATLFALNGRRANVRKYTNTAGSSVWCADISTNGYTLTTNVERKWLGDGHDVYCLSVPSTYLLVRRNGKIQVTGNCQNIPARSDLGREVRKAFIPGKGKLLVGYDYAQIELRWMADRAEEPNMIRIFREKGDIHLDTAMRAFLIDDPKKVDKILHRAPCKNVNFGVAYGLGAIGLYDLMALTYATAGLELPDWLTLEWCEKFIEKWFDLYPAMRIYFALQHYRAMRYGITWCGFGGVRMIPEVQSCHERIRQAGLRQAGNNPIQRAAAGIFKIGMARVEDLVLEPVRESGVYAEALLPIHDELLSEVEDEYAEEVGVMIGHEMELALWDEERKEMRSRVPILVDGKTMSRWVKE